MRWQWPPSANASFSSVQRNSIPKVDSHIRVVFARVTRTLIPPLLTLARSNSSLKSDPWRQIGAPRCVEVLFAERRKVISPIFATLERGTVLRETNLSPGQGPRLLGWSMCR
jgi:hypothetical protein